VSNPKAKKNLAASVRQRLLNIARERNEDFGLVLTKYGLERILFRLSQSRHQDAFVLKGALLFELWTEQEYRPTRDADFLATGENSLERFSQVFKDVSTEEVEDDGLRFDAESVKAERIKEDADYEGVRVTLMGYLDNARIPIQIDIGFGDVVTPGPVETEYPGLLDLPRARLLAYPKETVVAEKFEALVKLGMANSRMKDFHDLYTLASQFELEGKVLGEAIRRTFDRRGTELPANGLAFAFTEKFHNDENKIKQWKAFCKKNKRYVQERELNEVVADIAAFLVPVAKSVQAKVPFTGIWKSGGPWSLVAK
jgi:predicted nucleotidyltransferase component of viral defense system